MVLSCGRTAPSNMQPPRESRNTYPINFFSPNEEARKALWEETTKGTLEFWCGKGMAVTNSG